METIPMALLILLCVAQFVVVLDVTVVNVALPSIQADLGFSYADLQWVVTAYTLAFGGLLLLGGRLADLLGRRRMFIAGLSIFSAASLASGLAGSAGVLLTARAAQGVGAALLSPAALSLITTVFADGPERRRALAAWTAVGASGAAFGVLLGGVLTEQFGWEAIFLINVPVGVMTAYAARRMLPTTAPNTSGRFDLAGALAATTSIVALIYGLVGAGSVGWDSRRTLISFTTAILAGSAFVIIETLVSRPLVPLGILRRRTTATALVLMAVAMGTLVSGFFFSSLYLQQVLGHSALRAGLEFLPVAAAIVIAAHVSSQVIGRTGPKPVIVTGLVLASAGALLLSRVSAEGSYASDILPGFLALAFGVGLAAVGITVTAMSGADPELAGLVSGLVSTAHEIGIALVLAVLSTIAVVQIGGSAGTDTSQLAAGVADAYRAAAAVALIGALVAVAALRRRDVVIGETTAIMAH
jgi:EmrB/QacA subfamily drug resistance transporter